MNITAIQVQNALLALCMAPVIYIIAVGIIREIKGRKR